MADARQWYDALKELAGSDVDDPAMAQDAILRSRASVLTARDMRLVLLATADTPAWARQTVMDDLVLHLERARRVLSTHTQIEVWPSLRFQTDDHPAQKTAAAVIGPAGAEVTGPVQSAPTSREAKDRAALALLARLVGVALPGEPADQAPPGRLVLPVMPTEVFEQRLRRQVEVGQAPGAELEEEVLQRARASRLRHRDLYLLLLVAGGEAWTAARKAALDRAVAMPPAPARLLHWHAEQYGEDHGLTYQEDPVDEHGRHHTRARFTTPEETRLGPRRSATARKAARHHAAGALLAQLAGLPEPAPPNDDKPSPTPKITVPDKNQDPVKRLDKLRQFDLITKPEANVRKRGPASKSPTPVGTWRPGPPSPRPPSDPTRCSPATRPRWPCYASSTLSTPTTPRRLQAPGTNHAPATMIRTPPSQPHHRTNASDAPSSTSRTSSRATCCWRPSPPAATSPSSPPGPEARTRGGCGTTGDARCR
ncbi:hypothetical protein ACFWDT_30610 [Streptomyces diastaticus]|uniref:hypothetical protein n=1 Tax=Streptomyces diastaticus TaxID=1956 RepID=UPI003686521C